MRLRILDLGGVGGLRSQAVYHALCDSVSEGAPSTLAVLYPTEPYVCLGFHRDLEEEVDTRFCADRRLPVYRRRVGGGTVYLNPDQIFFQLILHERQVRMSVARAYAQLLSPAVDAYRTLGIAAEVAGLNDIAIDGRKLSGTGMARIGDAVVLVGNVILDLDHATMASILKLPDAFARSWVEHNMRHWVTSIRGEGCRVPTYPEVAAALIGAFTAWAGEPPEHGRLSERECDLIQQAEERLSSPGWLQRDNYELAPATPSPVRRVKIRAGRWDGIFDWSLLGQPVRAYVSADQGVLQAVRLAPLNGASPADRRSLERLERMLPGVRAIPDEMTIAIATIVTQADAGRLAELLTVAGRSDG